MTLAKSEEVTDPLLRQIGEIGKWQVVTFVALSLFCIPVAWQMVSVTFFAPGGIEHWCGRPKGFKNWTLDQWRNYAIPFTVNEDGERVWAECEVYARDYMEVPEDPETAPPPPDTNATASCPGHSRKVRRWEFNNSFYTWTIVEHFELVCEYEYLLGPIKAVYMAGVMVGAVVGGMIADRFGRRPTILALLGATLLVGLVSALSQTVMVYVVLRFLLATVIISAYTTTFCFCMEMFGDRWRMILGLVFQIPFALGYISLAGIAYAITNWQHLQLAITLPILLFSIYYWAVPESPRWLLSTGKLERASALIESIAEINGREFDPDLELIPKNEERSHVYIMDLLRHSAIRYRTLNMWFTWFANIFLYYGLLFSFAEVGNDLYLNALIGGTVELFAYPISIFICLWLGRRWPIAILMCTAGACIVGTAGFEPGAYERDWPILLLTMLSRFFITASFGIIYVYAAEVFPTVLRNTGVSSSSTVGRIGAIIAPLLTPLRSHYQHLPALAYGIVSIVSGLLILLMPETRGQRLPDTIEDAMKLGGLGKDDQKKSRPASAVPSIKTFPPIVEEDDNHHTPPLTENRAFKPDERDKDGDDDAKTGNGIDNNDIDGRLPDDYIPPAARNRAYDESDETDEDDIRPDDGEVRK